MTKFKREKHGKRFGRLFYNVLLNGVIIASQEEFRDYVKAKRSDRLRTKLIKQCTWTWNAEGLSKVLNRPVTVGVVSTLNTTLPRPDFVNRYNVAGNITLKEMAVQIDEFKKDYPDNGITITIERVPLCVIQQYIELMKAKGVFLAIHEPDQGCRNPESTIGFLVVLKDPNHHSTGCQGTSVEGMQ